ncbi:hypothetical protein J2T09_003853 [Neorhizobium huautlense]|uniref:Uncharacterized protein n=1 Tax=Neorhizobium huautlense TaxID=67774 RepID=A0ABT9PX64_9HYPH|nr:hypothetical protein [Neorhizobium huautlense]
MRIAKWLAIAAPVIVLFSGYLSGYGWLIQEVRSFGAKGDEGTCRYQTLRGVRIAYYLGDCPKFSTAHFPDEQKRF